MLFRGYINRACKDPANFLRYPQHAKSLMRAADIFLPLPPTSLKDPLWMIYLCGFGVYVTPVASFSHACIPFAYNLCIPMRTPLSCRYKSVVLVQRLLRKSFFIKPFVQSLDQNVNDRPRPELHIMQPKPARGFSTACHRRGCLSLRTLAIYTDTPNRTPPRYAI